MPLLEFCLPSADIPRLLRLPALARRAGRPATLNWIWHDTPTGELEAEHLALCQAGTQWRLTRASPAPAEYWPPGTPGAVLAEGMDPGLFGHILPVPLMPIAGFHGRRRLLRLDSDGPATLEILDGMVRGVAQESPVCRITLQGPDAWLQATSLTMAEALPLSVPLASLPVEAMALARGLPCPARHSGGPVVVPGSSVGASISLIIGHLTDVILASVPDVVAAQSPDPVHGMRVAIRRLRSAFSIFRRAADGPAFGAIQQPLRDLAILLGVARDWDVFLAGTGADVAAAFEGDRRISAMLVTAAKQRDAAYAGLRRFFASPEYRQIALSLVHLSALDLWRAELDEEHRAALEEEIGPYATALLTKRHAQMLRPGRDISDLPVEELHDLRKQGKRLRYAAEFFAPLYGRNDTKRFIRRVSDLQEELGHLNDGAAAASLMEALHGSLFAAGVVQGFTAARAGDVRAGIAGAWSKFRKAEPFWS